ACSAGTAFRTCPRDGFRRHDRLARRVCDNGPWMASPAEDVSTLTTSTRAPCRVLSLRGELDEVAAPVLDQALGEEREEPLIVDLSGLEYICSAGIHVLLRR